LVKKNRLMPERAEHQVTKPERVYSLALLRKAYKNEETINSGSDQKPKSVSVFPTLPWLI
jgi:hypothetical protein